MKKGWFDKLCIYASLTLSIIITILWRCNAGGFKAVNLDTFVGVIVALLAIIVTIVLGWQIVNGFELRQKIKELETIKQQFKYQQDIINQLSIQTLHRLNLTWGDIELDRKHYALAFRYYLVALKNSLLLTDSLNIATLEHDISFVSNKIEKGAKLDEKLYRDVIQTDNDIKKNSSFHYIENWYKTAFDKFIENVNK